MMSEDLVMQWSSWRFLHGYFVAPVGWPRMVITAIVILSHITIPDKNIGTLVQITLESILAVISCVKNLWTKLVVKCAIYIINYMIWDLLDMAFIQTEWPGMPGGKILSSEIFLLVISITYSSHSHILTLH